MIKALVVEDSAIHRELLVHILSSDPEILVIGTARDGFEALELVRRSRPDVITMDIKMPRMDGLEATRRIMETMPVPIVVIAASLSRDDLNNSFQAIEAGAVAVLEKPRGFGHADCEKDFEEIVRTVKCMSEVKVIRRRLVRRNEVLLKEPLSSLGKVTRKEIHLVAIGASTGGPQVILSILSSLPKDFGAPIVLVQHMAAGFIQGFVDWLAKFCALEVRVAAHGDRLLPGHVYVAPSESHTTVTALGTISLVAGQPEHGLRPAVSPLFRSCASSFGKRAVGILLSGMGTDGAEELKLMKDQGALTIAQDKASCVVDGMPRAAVELGAVTHVLIPEEIAALLQRLVGEIERP